MNATENTAEFLKSHLRADGHRPTMTRRAGGYRLTWGTAHRRTCTVVAGWTVVGALPRNLHRHCDEMRARRIAGQNPK